MAKVTTTATTSPLTTRKRMVTGIVLVAIGLSMFGLFVTNTQPGQTATFGMNLGDTAVTIPDLALPVQPSLYALVLISVFLGAWQLARGGLRSIGWSIGIVAFCFVAGFLIWATQDKSLDEPSRSHWLLCAA